VSLRSQPFLIPINIRCNIVFVCFSLSPINLHSLLYGARRPKESEGEGSPCFLGLTEWRKGVKLLLLLLNEELRDMAPVPISNTNPTVKITKNNTATQNP